MPHNHGTFDLQGTMRFKVVFLANGTIGSSVLIQGLPADNVTSLASDAVRKKRFAPAFENGKPIDTSGIISFTHSPWRFWSVPEENEAEVIIGKAVKWMGGDRFVKIKTQIGKGKFSVLKEGIIVSFQSFYDAIIFPDRERTEFKGQGARIVQVNEGVNGWLFNADNEEVRDQTPRQIENFIRGRRISLENLLRGDWRKEAEISYVGRRPSSLGKRNDVVKLTYNDGFEVEFEFAVDDASPQKSLTRRHDSDGNEIIEEDRYARFIEINGIKLPMIIDRFINGRPVSRVSFESIQFDRPVPASLFAKPANPKAAKKGMQLN